MAGQEMRVLFLHLGETLGAWIRIENILRHLRKLDFKVYEASLPQMSLRYIKQNGIANVFSYLLPFHRFSTYSFKNPLRYLNLILERNYMDWICQNVDFDLIIAETSMVGHSALYLREKKRVPCIIDVHGLMGAETKGMGYEARARLLDKLETEAFQSCDHLLVVSKTMKEFIITHYKIPPNKISVIFNGSQVYPYQAKHNLPLKVIFAGIFEYWENVDDYLDIAKKADPNIFRFFLAGNGSLREKILKRIKEEKIPIKYLGYIPRKKIFSIMAKMQVGIAPSSKDIARRVAFPIKILDYMACGLPVIAPKVGDWSQIIKIENCGIVIDNDIADYLEALNKLIDKNIWLEKSTNGIRAINTKYNWNRVLSPLKDILTSFY